MSIQYFGMDAFRAAVERGFELAEIAEAKLRTMARWEIVTPAQMGIVTFRHRGGDESIYPKLHDAMLRDGFALATSTILNGGTVLRLCTINPPTTEDEIHKTLDWIDRDFRPRCRATAPPGHPFSKLTWRKPASRICWASRSAPGNLRMDSGRYE